MRDIRFRAWDKLEKKMWIPWISPNGIPCVRHVRTGGVTLMNACVIDPIMQFTGLYDKNGKKIYEGDIIDVRQEAVIFIDEVIFEKGEFKFSRLDRFGNSVSLIPFIAHGNILGNIYENPELLESK